MSLPHTVPVTLGLAAGLACATSPAHAETLDLGWAVDLAASYLEPALASVLAALAGWLLTRLGRLIGVSIDASLAQRLHEAIARALRSAVTEGVSRLKGRSMLEIENALIANAARYLEQTMPGALAHFNLSPEALDALIRAHLSPETVMLLGKGEA